MSVRLLSHEREILRKAFSKREWVDLYPLHEKTLISPGQLYAATSKFGQLGLLELNGIYVRLTDSGRRWVMTHRHSIFYDSNSRPWAAPSSKWVKEPHPATAPYLPALGRIERSFFRRQ